MQFTFIHGWASSPQIWQPLQHYLGGNNQYCCLALPWLNAASLQNVSLLPMDEYIQRIKSALARADVIVGWSLGGLIAAGFLSQCMEWKGRLVLIAAPLKFVADSTSTAGIDDSVLTAFIKEFEQSPTQVIDRFVALQAQGDEFSRSCRKTLQTSLDYRAEMQQELRNGLMLLRTMDYRSVVASNRFMPLVIHGQNDQVVSWHASAQMCHHANIPSFHSMPRCGHAPHVSHAEQVAEIIQSNVIG